MKFQVTPQYLNHVYPSSQLNYIWAVEHLSLDLGHMQLLRDCYQQWEHVEDEWVAVLLYLVHAVNQGSLCINIHDSQFLQSLRQMGVEDDIDANKIEVWSQFKLAGKQILVFSQGCLYFAKYWQYERNLKATLEQLIINHSGSVFGAEDIAQVAWQTVDELTFDTVEDKQIQAIVMSLLQPFSIISGGPGTGKTTIMASVLRALLKLGFRPEEMVLAAPTGRAANRMTESLHDVITNHVKSLSSGDKKLLENEAMTIHRLLGAHPYRGRFNHGQHNPLDCKVLVIDEVSMVDVMLMKQLLQAVPNDCRVLILGDQFQLPSVESGAVLADLMPPLGMDAYVSENMKNQLTQSLAGFAAKENILAELTVTESPQLLSDKVTVLDVSKRCQEDIATISEQVRQGNSEVVLKLPQQHEFNEAGVYFTPATEERKFWIQYYQSWVNSHYFSKASNFKQNVQTLQGFDENNLAELHTALDELFKTIVSNRILTMVNQSHLGSHSINEQVVEMMRTQLGFPGYQNMFHGSVIMMLKNDRALNLFNGDIGILLENKTGQLRAVFPFKNSYVSHSIHVIPAFKSAYAITVHKSQGSEFEHVLMPLLPDGDHNLMTREIIYTGMTRAKKSVIFYGEKKPFITAIQKQTKRHTGLCFWYNESSLQQET
jgi:exodeoxyribonuclease V alpha subunit